MGRKLCHQCKGPVQSWNARLRSLQAEIFRLEEWLGGLRHVEDLQKKILELEGKLGLLQVADELAGAPKKVYTYGGAPWGTPLVRCSSCGNQAAQDPCHVCLTAPFTHH